MDTALKGMANELREALELSGVPLERHPALETAPTEKVFAEYQRRGGIEYNNPDDLVKALVEEVKNPA